MWHNCCCNTEPCDGSCYVYGDTFTRADNPSLGTGWTKDAGTSEIKDNELKLSASNSKTTYDPAGSLAGAAVSFVARAEDDDDEIIIWLAADFYFVLTAGPLGKIQAYSGAVGLCYECDYAIPVGVNFTCTILLSDLPVEDTTTITIDGNIALSVLLQDNSPLFESVSCACGSITTAVYFDRVCILESASVTPGCITGEDCPWILDGSNAITVDIANAINNGTIDYTPINGTYAFTLGADCRSTIAVSFTIDGNLIDSAELYLAQTAYRGTQTMFVVTVAFYSGGSALHVYQQAYGNDQGAWAGLGFPATAGGFCGTTLTLQSQDPDKGDCTVSY